jgi:hypothetical protein
MAGRPKEISMADAKKPSEVTTLLSDPSTLAASINAESDSINSIIKHFEETLQRLNFGIEVWAASNPVRSVLAERKAEDDDESVRRETSTELGFCRWTTDWTLCLREALYEVSTDSYGDEEWKLKHTYAKRQLLKASRADRIASLAQFPALLRELKDAAEQSLKAIHDAKAFVAQC